MKNTAYLINVARGAVVVEEDLYEALANGEIKGAGLDVLNPEPMKKDSMLLKIQDSGKLIVTPHMAWGAHESRVRCVSEIAKNIETFLMGGKRNRVDLK